MGDIDTRDQIEMWAVGKHTARTMTNFMSTAGKTKKKKKFLPIGDPMSGVPRGPVRSTPAPAPVPAPAPLTLNAPSGGWTTVGGTPRGGGSPSRGGGSPRGGGRGTPRGGGSPSRGGGTPRGGGGRNTALAPFDVVSFKRTVLKDVKNETRDRFGRLYEMFLANEISNTGRWVRYRNFTSSVYVKDLVTYLDWVSVDSRDFIDVNKIDKYKDGVALYLQSYGAHYRTMETNFNNNNRPWANVEKNLPNSRYVFKLASLQRDVNSGHLSGPRLWPYYLSSKIYDPANCEVLQRDFGMLCLNTELEIDLAGHTWMTEETHHLHFGEIKSSTSKRGTKKGIAQLIRLGYGAMWTMSHVNKGKKIHVEATLFANDDDENDYSYVSEFSDRELTSHAKNIISLLKDKPSNATFKLSYQITKGNTIDDRNDYGLILSI